MSRITIMAALLTLFSHASQAAEQDSLWAKAKSNSRFYVNQMIDISNIDSIDFNTARIRFWKDGKTTSQSFANTEYFSFHNPGQTLYCPGEFKNMDWNDEASEWCFQRSMESEHFIVFWHAGFGADPTKAASGYAFNPQRLLTEAEKIYKVNTLQLGFSRPGSSYTLDHYKHMLFVRYQTEWLATGSGYDDKIGAFWCCPAAVNDLSTLAHELGHTFQYLVRCDLGAGHGWRQGLGPKGEGGNMYWESCAQWQSAMVYPQYVFTGYGSGYPSTSHKNLLHEDPRYYNYFPQYYWIQLHGTDFIGRLWMAATGYEDPVDVYKRLTGRTQAEFCDDMFEYARRTPTWDIDNLRSRGANFRDRFTTSMHDDENGWLMPDPQYCPENYGFNVIRMKLPDSNTSTVRAHFKGKLGTNGYRAVETDKAGWRYGFVALTKNDQRVYSDVGRDDEGTLDFDIPANTTNLWFVTMGAPTEHFHHTWDDNEKNDEQWPYAVHFEGTDMQGHVYIEPNTVPHDTTIVCNLTATWEDGKLISSSFEPDISGICSALVCTTPELQLTQSSQDTIRVYTAQPDGTLCDTYANKYSLYFIYDKDGNVLDPQTQDDAEEQARFYAIYASYSNRYFVYYGEVNEQTLKAGDKHTFEMAFVRTLSDGQKVTARLQINLTVKSE